jgi:hypothetical protein
VALSHISSWFERTIGRKKGTGGSPGVPFLKNRCSKPIFPISGQFVMKCDSGANRAGRMMKE